MRLGLLTSTRYSHFYEDDLLLVNELRARKNEVDPVVWTEPLQPARYDALIMRTPWDWYEHRVQFREFLGSLRTAGVKVLNAPDVMLRYADKRYLAELAKQGLSVIPTEQLEQSELHTVPARLAASGWKRAVLKPAFTANAVGARQFDSVDAARVVSELSALPPGEPWLLQPFVPAIADGERSFVFFGGAFSHGVLKRPKSGEWRVQHDYGGVAEPWTPSTSELEQASALLQSAAPGTLYARVDAVPFEGKLCLMELEVVEPELFFRVDPHAPSRFADALEFLTR